MVEKHDIEVFLDCIHRELNLSDQPSPTVVESLRRGFLDMEECPHIQVSVVKGMRELIAASEKLKKSQRVEVTFSFGGSKSDPVVAVTESSKADTPASSKFYFFLGESAANVPPDRQAFFGHRPR